MTLEDLLAEAARRDFSVYMSNHMGFWIVQLSQGDPWSARGLSAHVCSHTRAGETLADALKIAIDNARPGARFYRGAPPKEEEDMSDLLDDEDEESMEAMLS